MTPEALRAEIARLGVSQGGLGRLAGYTSRTVRRWLSGELDIPPAVSLLLPKLTKGEVKKILKEREHE